MAPGANRVIGFEDLGVFVNQIANSSRIASLGVVAGAIGQAQFSGGVAEQQEGEVILTRERRVIRDGIKAHAQHFDVARTKLIDLVAEPAAFGCSPGRVGFGIEPQHRFLPFEIAKREGFSFMRLHGEMRGRIARFQHRWVLLS